MNDFDHAIGNPVYGHGSVKGTFAEIAKKVQMETVELMMAAGKEASEEATAAVKKATAEATTAVKKAATAK